LVYVQALAAFFGVGVTYFLDRAVGEPVLDRIDATAGALTGGAPEDEGAEPEAEPPDPITLFRIRAALWRLSRELIVGSESDNLTPTQASVLTIIHMQGPLGTQDLVATEGINPTMASRIVSELVRRGWVERNPDPSDARGTLAQVTPRGAAVSSRIRRQRNASLAKAMRTLPGSMSGAIEAALPALELLAARLRDTNARE
jgi:DNA-binding MarR family transcriptional regulator